MKSFTREFLNEDFEDVPGAPAVYVAAFGKHPAWNDHMDDIGLVTESLVEAKRRLYIQGISSQIESRAWERLGAEKVLAGFDHVFLWHRPNETILGLIWSSRDGKGRQLYPMVVCAHIVGLPLDWIWAEVLPRMNGVAEACRVAATQKDVIVALNTMQEALRRRSTTGTPREAGAAPRTSEAGIAEWTAHFTRDKVALRRICHHLSSRVSRTVIEADSEQRSECVRLPAIPGATLQASLNAWLRFFTSQGDPFLPVLLLMPRVGNWVDIMVGEPSKEDFYRLRASPGAEPIVSEIPYTFGEPEPQLERCLSDVSLGRMPQMSFLTGRAAETTVAAAIAKLRGSRRSTAKDFFTRLLKRE
jgi:hypothetical protein